MNKEIWKDMNCSKKHEISSIGRIRNKKTKRILRLFVRENGYITISLSTNGKVKQRYVHRLVAEAFIEKINGKNCVNHKNSIRSDNVVENLEWVTQKENILHGIKNTRNKNKKFNSAKLSGEDVVDILKSIETQSTVSIAKKYGVDKSTIRSIVIGKSWKHVGDKIGHKYNNQEKVNNERK